MENKESRYSSYPHSSSEIYEEIDSNTFSDEKLTQAIKENNLSNFLSQYRLYKKDNPQQIWLNKSGNNILQIAVAYGATTIIHNLLQSENDRTQLIDARNHKGQSALHFLPCNQLEDLKLSNAEKYREAISNISSILKMLVSSGCKINAIDENYDTALHFAATRDPEIVRLLIECGAKIDAENKEKATPLQLASADGKFEVAFVLIENGANIAAQDRNGLSAIHYAALWQEKICPKTGVKILPSALVDANKVIDLLLQKDHKLINAKDKSGYTPLHFAAQNNQANIAQHLLARGANIEAKIGSALQKFRAQHNPFYLAAKNYSEKTIDVMLKFIKEKSVAKAETEHYGKFLQENISALKDREKSRASKAETAQEKSYDFLIAKIQAAAQEIIRPNLPPIPPTSAVSSASRQRLGPSQTTENIYQ